MFGERITVLDDRRGALEGSDALGRARGRRRSARDTVLPAAAVGQEGAREAEGTRPTRLPGPPVPAAAPQRRRRSAGRCQRHGERSPIRARRSRRRKRHERRVLLIDASQSMAGEPIEEAMDAARAFMKRRNPEMPVAVMVYNPEQHVLTDFTTDAATLNEAVATIPEVAWARRSTTRSSWRPRWRRNRASSARPPSSLGRAGAEQRVRSLGDTRGARCGQHARDRRRLPSSRYQPARWRPWRGHRREVIPAARTREFVTRLRRSGSSSRTSTSSRTLLPSCRTSPAEVAATVTGYPTASAPYTTPELAAHRRRGTFERAGSTRDRLPVPHGLRRRLGARAARSRVPHRAGRALALRPARGWRST